MTISIGSIDSQAKADFNESTVVDRVTSSHSNRVREGPEADSMTETTTLIAGVTSVGELTAAALDRTEVRTDKISQLRQSIEAGSYKVEPQDTARAILSDWQQTGW